jgi:hypothetical protein
MRTFYLGTHQPHWLATADWPAETGLFVSHRRLTDRKTLPRAQTHWALDSGGFTELQLHGRWETSPAQYVAAVRRYDEQIGNLGWAAPQDWMCEPHILTRTGLTIAEHQQNTVNNFAELSHLWGDHDSPFMPVLQGWTRDDYLHCWQLYDKAGIDLANYPVVGVGSVCRRQHTGEIGAIMAALRARDPDLPIHGFGVKTQGLLTYGHHLNTADSMAWSYEARRNPPLPGCTGHKNCANCPRYARRWAGGLLESLRRQSRQLDLFEVAA